MLSAKTPDANPPDLITLFLCGDVMTGRGIDQILPYPNAPRLYEPYVTSAVDYVKLAEAVHGPIPQPVDYPYPWGDALKILNQAAPDVRIINLETAVTRSNDPWPGKGIHYRMHPQNVPCLTVAGIDCCVIANNHVLDWSYAGLAETLTTLHQANLKTTGAGHDRQAAQAPAVLTASGKGRVLVFAFGHESSGIPERWAARPDKPGVNRLEDLSEDTVRHIATQIQAVKQPRDIIVASLHWGGNWGYAIPDSQHRFARQLIDQSGVDIVHGHSSHHPKGIEVYHQRPILYGCGDLINDYEGIQGYESFRDDLTFLYLLSMAPAKGHLVRFTMVPMQLYRFRLQRASPADARWLAATLDRECRQLGCQVTQSEDNSFILHWQA